MTCTKSILISAMCMFIALMFYPLPILSEHHPAQGTPVWFQLEVNLVNVSLELVVEESSAIWTVSPPLFLFLSARNANHDFAFV